MPGPKGRNRSGSGVRAAGPGSATVPGFEGLPERAVGRRSGSGPCRGGAAEDLPARRTAYRRIHGAIAGGRGLPGRADVAIGRRICGLSGALRGAVRTVEGTMREPDLNRGARYREVGVGSVLIAASFVLGVVAGALLCTAL